MKRERKGKGKEGVNQINRRPFTRNQAKAMANPSTPVKITESPSSSSDALSLSYSPFRFGSRKSAKKSEATTNIKVKKLGKSLKESTPTIEDVHNLQQSDQQSSSPATGDIRALVDNLLVSVPVKEVNMAAAETVAPNIISSKEVPVEEAQVETSVFTEWPRDNFVNEDQSQSHNLGLTEVVNMCADDACGEEVESSAFKSALVPVWGYRVKESTVPILKGILEKHGDIAVDCTVKTVESRSLLLESLCDVEQKLGYKKFSDITQDDIDYFFSSVKAFEGFKLDVGWLRKRLEDIVEARGVIKIYSNLKEEKAIKCQAIQQSKRALKWYRSEALEYESNILESKAKILEWESAVQKIKQKAILEQGKLEAAQADSSRIRERVDNAQANIELFINCSLNQGLH